MSDIKIFEVKIASKKFLVAGISKDNVKDFILENKKKFKDLDSKEIDIRRSVTDFGMEVTFLNNDIEILHTIERIDLVNEDDPDLNVEDVLYTYELDPILIARNSKNEKMIVLDCYDELFI